MIWLLSICGLALTQSLVVAYADGVSASAGASQHSDGQGRQFGNTYTSTGQYPAPQYGSGFSYQPPFNQAQQFAQAAAFPGGFPGFPAFPQQQQQHQQQHQQQQFGGFPSFQPQQPLPPLLTPAQFSQALQQYVDSVQKQYAAYSGGSFAWSTPGASASAFTNLGPTNIYEQQQKQWDSWKNTVANSPPQQQQQQSGYAPPNVATATGSYGPQGIHQTASLQPENPQSPNVDTRYEAAPQSNGGYVGISTSSFSSSSDVNGVKTQRKGAVTTVNDNGKITTYKLDS